MAEPGGSGSQRQAEVDADFRTRDARARIVQTLTVRLAQFYQNRLPPSSPQLLGMATQIEGIAFDHANNNKEVYLRSVSKKLMDLEKRWRQEQRLQIRRANVGHGASGVQQQSMQTCPAANNVGQGTSGAHQQIRQTWPANNVGQGRHSTVSMTPQTVMTAPAQGSPCCQMQNLSMSGQSSGIATNQNMVLVHPSPPNVQIKVKQEEPADMTISGPNMQRNRSPMQQYSIMKNQQIVSADQHHMVNQQSVSANQHHMVNQNYQMVGSQQASVTQIRHNNLHNAGLAGVLKLPYEHQGIGKHISIKSEPTNPQQQIVGKQINVKTESMTPPQQQIVGGQQSSLRCSTPQISGSARQTDWRDKMFDRIQLLKNRYLADLVELDQNCERTIKEQSSSLHGVNSEQHKKQLHLKHWSKEILTILQLEKSKIPNDMLDSFPKCELIIPKLVQISRQLKARNANMNKSQQAQKHADQPVTINLSTGTSHGLQSPIAMSGALMKPGLPPSPVAKPGAVPVATSCSSMKPNDSNMMKTNPTTPFMSASPSPPIEAPASQTQSHGGAETETPVANTPVQRLIAAIRASSPEELQRSARAIWSAVYLDDCIPYDEQQTFEDWIYSRRLRRSKMNRCFDVTSRRESPTTDSESECEREGSIKRQKTQETQAAGRSWFTFQSVKED